MVTPRKKSLDGFAVRLREVLLQRYESIPQAAEAAKIPYKTVNRYIKGTRSPSAEEMRKLALLLGDEIFYVLTGVSLEGQRGASLALAARQLDDENRQILLRCAQLLTESREDIPKHLAQLCTYIEATIPESPRTRRVLRAASHQEIRALPPHITPPCRDS